MSNGTNTTNSTILWLRDIADYALQPAGQQGREYEKRQRNNKIRHDARAITELLKTNSLASSLHDSTQDSHVRRFRQFCGRNQALDLAKLTEEDLLLMIVEIYERLDELFFCDLLTRVVWDGTKQTWVPLVSVAVDNVGDAKNFAQFRFDTHTIHVWPYKPDDTHHSFDRLLYAVVHEMVHAYLDIFIDKTDPDAVTEKGLSEIVRVVAELLEFITEKLYVITGSKKLKHWRDMWKDESIPLERYAEI